MQVGIPAAPAAGGARCRRPRVGVGGGRRRPAPPPPRAVAATQASPQQLLDWLKSQHGVDASKFAAAPTGPGGALAAPRGAARGETLLAVPEPAWLTPAAAAAAAPALGPHLAGLEPWVALALFLLHERGRPGAAWGPYVDSLPAAAESPAAWSEAELASLAGTQLLASVRSYRAFFRARYDELAAGLFKAAPDVFAPDRFGSFDDFLWAALTVRGRAHAPLDGGALALVPLADRAAHAAGARGGPALRPAGLLGRARALALEAPAALPPGAPVAFDYGRGGRTEGQVLLDHGAFDFDSPSAGGFALTLELPPDDRFRDDKADILELAGLPAEGPMEFVLRAAPGPAGGVLPDGLLPALRLLNLRGADAFLLESIFRAEAWGHMALPVSEENEAAVCASMAGGCRAALAAYDDCDAQAAAAPPGPRARVAAAVRAGERAALAAALEEFEARAEALPRLEYYAERRLKSLKLLDSAGRSTYDSFFEDGVA